MVVGIDVGAGRLHCVALDDARRLAGTWLLDGGELKGIAATLAGAAVVAIDAPAQLSSLPHLDDDGLAPKFRRARCAEVALGRGYGWWVPWVGPAVEPETGWLRTGLDAFRALAAAGVATVEVFPHACFRALAGGARLPRKVMPAGVRARAELLDAAGVRIPDLVMWSHDGLDALVAAITAADLAAGRAVRVSCGHDDSALWLPASQVATVKRPPSPS